MSFDVFSIDFFKQIAMSKADKNNDGEINENEYENNGSKIHEKSIFDAEFQKFDMDKNGTVDEKDVEMYKKAVGATKEDQDREAKLKKFKEQHPNFDITKATKEEIAEFEALCSSESINQRFEMLNFSKNVQNAATYLFDTNSELINKYWHSISKTLHIDNNTENIQEVKKDMKSSTAFIGAMILNNSNEGQDTQKLAESLCSRVINTADKATNDFSVQKEALMNLKSLNLFFSIKNDNLIDDIIANLITIKENLENELQNPTTDTNKEYINHQLDEINKLLDEQNN